MLLFRRFLWIAEAKAKAENTQLSSNLDPLSAGLGPGWPSPDQDGGTDWRRPPPTEAGGLEEADDTTGWVKAPSVLLDLHLQSQVLGLYRASGERLHTAEKGPWATQLGRSARPEASPGSALPSASAGGLEAAGLKEGPTASGPCSPPGPSAACRPSHSQSSGCHCWASWGCACNTFHTCRSSLIYRWITCLLCRPRTQTHVTKPMWPRRTWVPGWTGGGSLGPQLNSGPTPADQSTRVCCRSPRWESSWL